MAETMIASARKAGVTEDFHVFSDQPVAGAINHEAGTFDHDRYIFKFEFLKQAASLIDADYLVFLDADNFFVRHPGDLSRLIRDNKWWVQMESEMTSPFVNRGDWWGCQARLFPVLLKHLGVQSQKVWNTNAGMFIVRRDAVEEFYQEVMKFYTYCRNDLRLVNFTEEPALAFIGHFVDDPAKNTLGATCSIWACDWTGNYKDRLPDGQSWQFEDYMSGEKRNVNPAIVHLMRGKDAMVAQAQLDKAMVKFQTKHDPTAAIDPVVDQAYAAMKIDAQAKVPALGNAGKHIHADDHHGIPSPGDDKKVLAGPGSEG